MPSATFTQLTGSRMYTLSHFFSLRSLLVYLLGQKERKGPQQQGLNTDVSHQPQSVEMEGLWPSSAAKLLFPFIYYCRAGWEGLTGLNKMWKATSSSLRQTNGSFLFLVITDHQKSLKIADFKNGSQQTQNAWKCISTCAQAWLGSSEHPC